MTAAPGLHAYNSAACDDGTVLGSGGQTAYDDSVVPGTTNQHYLYVAQNDHLSPGVIRFTFDPSADSGAGALVDGSAVVMAPNAGLNGDKANGLALGPCKAGAPATCKHSLYMGGLLDGFIRRINNPEDDPRVQTVDVVAMTTEQRAGVARQGHQRFDGHDRRRPVPAGEPGLHGRQGHQRLPDEQTRSAGPSR